MVLPVRSASHGVTQCEGKGVQSVTHCEGEVAQGVADFVTKCDTEGRSLHTRWKGFEAQCGSHLGAPYTEPLDPTGNSHYPQPARAPGTPAGRVGVLVAG